MIDVDKYFLCCIQLKKTKKCTGFFNCFLYFPVFFCCFTTQNKNFNCFIRYMCNIYFTLIIWFWYPHQKTKQYCLVLNLCTFWLLLISFEKINKIKSQKNSFLYRLYNTIFDKIEPEKNVFGTPHKNMILKHFKAICNITIKNHFRLIHYCFICLRKQKEPHLIIWLTVNLLKVIYRAHIEKERTSVILWNPAYCLIENKQFVNP